MHNSENIKHCDLVAKLQVEMRILSDIARRVEYTIFEDLLPDGTDHSATDIQMLDLLIQSTEALETILGRLSVKMTDTGSLRAADLVTGLPLRDMAVRIAGSQTKTVPQVHSYSKSTIDLF